MTEIDAGTQDGAGVGMLAELDAEGWDVTDLEGDETAEGDGGPSETPPVLAVVGRPNVGKSTLVNRILGERRAIVEDIPGVTRDRVRYDAIWNGRKFVLLDTGGWEVDGRGLAAQVTASAQAGVAEAGRRTFRHRRRGGSHRRRRSRLPRSFAGPGSRCCSSRTRSMTVRRENDIHELWSLGLGQPHAVSALHGRGSGDLLDAALDALASAPREKFGLVQGGPRRIALIGRPNVGKSSLLNRLLGTERVLVDSVAGTTRDPVDSLVDVDGTTYLLSTRPGLRRRVHQAAGTEWFSSLRTEQALANAECALVLLDASEPLSEQDQRLLSMVGEAGRALVVVLNKWDLVDEDRRWDLDRELGDSLGRVRWAPRVNVSAKTGRAVDRLGPAIETALSGWEQRVPTSTLNTWVAGITAATPPPGRGGRIPRVQFATQAASKPPTFVFFTTGFLEAGYRRFLERKLREDFGFPGTPISVSVRVREKRTGGSGRKRP